MTISRIDLPDAVYQRAWSVADAAEKATLLAVTGPFSPRRGDVILQVDTGVYYLVVQTSIIRQLSGFAALPIDLATQVSGNLPIGQVSGNLPLTQVSGTLADGNLSSNIPLINANNVFTGDQTTRDLTATRDIYLGGRASPIGNWVPITPTLTAQAGTITLVTNLYCSYMIIDKTFYLAFYFSFTLSGTPQFFSITIPLSLSTAGYTLNVAAFNAITCIVQTIPADTKINFYRDITGGPLFPAGTHLVGGVHVFELS